MNYLFGTLLTANGSMKQLNITAAIGIVINVTVNLLLIPRMMACGSAVASFCTQFTVAFLQFLLALRIIGIPIKSLPWFRCLLFVAVLVPVTVLSTNILHLHVVWSLLIMAAVALVIGFATGLVDLRGMKDLSGMRDEK